MTTDFDVIISGGGIAGLTACAAFGHLGMRVLCLDPAPPVVDEKTAGADLRTTAFLQPSRDFLDRIGLWARFAQHASALQIMRIVDVGGHVGSPETHADARVIRDFDAADVSERPFGWNLPNWLLRREILAHLSDMDTVTLQMGTATRNVITREREVLVSTSSNQNMRAKLLVAADGRNSPVRQAVGIGARTIRYGQKALTFAVTHPVPHENVSTEIHRTGGPFTLVPLPDRDGKPCSAVVWMETGSEVARLHALPDVEFEAAMTARSAGLFGPLKLASPRSVWPIIAQIADRLSAERTALIAEAAHVVPPIGAQGLNMSLADLSALYELAADHLNDPGSRDMLEAYQRQRYRDIALRVKGIDLLNRTSMAQNPIMRAMRAKGLDTLYAMPPVRRLLMQMGLGTRQV